VEAEQALTSVGGIMSDADFNPNLVHEVLQILLKNVMTGAIGAAAIT
jgi:hypothetical protein